MNPCPTRVARPPCALAWLASSLMISSAWAADTSPRAAPEARYQREIAACTSPDYVGDRAACRKEAAAARAQRASLAAGEDPGAYARNAIKRCESLPEPDRADCVARMQGQGTTSGSPAKGGVLRELVTRETPSPAAASSASSSPTKP